MNPSLSPHPPDSEAICSGASRLTPRATETHQDWRLLIELAEGRPVRLVRLGPDALRRESRLTSWQECLDCDSGQFAFVAWSQLFESIEVESWVRDCCLDRGIVLDPG